MTNKNCDGIERAIFSGAAGEINNNNLLMTNKNCEGIATRTISSGMTEKNSFIFCIFT